MGTSASALDKSHVWPNHFRDLTKMLANILRTPHNTIYMYTENELTQILTTLITLPAETEIVEFKKAENTFSDNDLGQYFSALANEANLKGTDLAWLVFGVDNNTHHIIGTNYKPTRPSLDEMKKRIADQTTNRITFDEIYELHIEGHRVILFQIPAAPQGLPIAYKGHYYGRDNESLVALNLHEIELIRAQAKDAPCFEMQPAKGGLTGEEVLQLLDYKAVYEQIGRRVPKDEDIILDLLKEYGFATEASGKWAVTNMGALLFANRLADFDGIKTREVIVRKYEGLNNRVLSAERKTEKGYAVEFEDLVDWIEIQTSKERIVTLREREVTYPKVAVREFLANLMVHQDFTIKGMPLTVEILGNRLVFTNPGCSLNEVKRLIDLPPCSRNETLAQALLLVDICERRGSGYDRAVEAIEEMNLPPYKTESGDKFTRVTLYPQKALKDMTQEEKIQACYQHTCLLYEDGKELNNASLRKRFELEKNKNSVASRIIADTLSAGLIKVADENILSTKYITYIPFYG